MIGCGWYSFPDASIFLGNYRPLKTRTKFTVFQRSASMISGSSSIKSFATSLTVFYLRYLMVLKFRLLFCDLNFFRIIRWLDYPLINLMASRRLGPNNARASRFGSRFWLSQFDDSTAQYPRIVRFSGRMTHGPHLNCLQFSRSRFAWRTLGGTVAWLAPQLGVQPLFGGKYVLDAPHGLGRNLSR